MHRDDRQEQAFERALQQSLAAPAAVPVGDCVDAETLAAWSDGSLASIRAASVERHLSSCPSCQALLAAFVRTAPVEPAALPLWRRWHLQWLVPLATATAALTLYLALPGRTPARLEPERVDRSAAQGSAAPSPSVPPAVRAESSRFAAPTAPATPPVDLPRAAGRSPSQAAVADALAKVQEKRKREGEAGGGVTAVADAKPHVVAGSAVDVAAEAAAVAERKMADAMPAPQLDRAPVRPAAAPPPAASAIEVRPSGTPPPGRTGAAAPDQQGSTRAAAPSQAAPGAAIGSTLAFKVSTTDVVSPTSATRWRIAMGRPVDYFGPSAPSGRPTDIPAASVILAGSSPQDDVCWMVGRAGAVYVTTDGTHFTRIAFADTVDLIAVLATDANTAAITAASGRTYRTTDAGKSWQQQ